MKLIINGQSTPFEGPLTVAEVLATLGLTVEGVAVEINREVVPRATLAMRTVEEGDRLEIVTFVGGG